jgi:Maltokinase N-terminal cap domain
MALLHRADLRPTKLELLAEWLPGRRWYQGLAGATVGRVASCRFDDPAGAVGIETMLVRAGDGPVHQVPLTYRDAPLPGGDDWLVGTAEHSVLGRRWVYDACGDPVYAAALARAIFAGSGQAEEFFEVDGRLERREPSMTVIGTGGQEAGAIHIGAVRRVVDDDPTLILTDAVELAVVRCIGGSTGPAGATLTGTWSGQPAPVPLAYAARGGDITPSRW